MLQVLMKLKFPKMVAGYFDFDTNIAVTAFDSTGGSNQKNEQFS